LAEAIRYLLQKGKQSYSAACRKKAVELYSKEERYADYLDLYHEMINKNREEERF
jgi:glycosyltransferase involved in cell wall biosynthesis